MNMNPEIGLKRLESVTRVAVEYVGSANYAHREHHTLRQVEKAFDHYRAGRYDKIVFSAKEEE